MTAKRQSTIRIRKSKCRGGSERFFSHVSGITYLLLPEHRFVHALPYPPRVGFGQVGVALTMARVFAPTLGNLGQAGRTWRGRTQRCA